MKFLMLSYKDNRIGCFRNPFLYDKDIDALVIDLKTSFKGADPKAVEQIKDNALYVVGTFDQATGQIEPRMDFLFDVYPIALSMLDKGGEQDVSVSKRHEKEAN